MGRHHRPCPWESGWLPACLPVRLPAECIGRRPAGQYRSPAASPVRGLTRAGLGRAGRAGWAPCLLPLQLATLSVTLPLFLKGAYVNPVSSQHFNSEVNNLLFEASISTPIGGVLFLFVFILFLVFPACGEMQDTVLGIPAIYRKNTKAYVENTLLEVELLLMCDMPEPHKFGNQRVFRSMP